MDDSSLMIFSLLKGIQREKGLAILSRTTATMPEKDAFDTQAARNEALLSQIKETNLPQNFFLPQRIFQSLKLRSDPSFKEGLDCDSLSDWYLFHLEQPVQQAALALLVDWQGLTPSQNSATIHLLAALSYMGQLRDFGLGVYSKGEITHADGARLKALAQAFLSRERLFLNLADDNLRSKLGNLKFDDDDLRLRLDDFMRKLKSGYAKGLLAENSIAVWYETLNASLEHFQDSLAAALKQVAREETESQRFNNMANALDSDIDNNFHAISALPLFRGIEERTLRNTLKNARLINLEKNESFLAQGEPANRFFILLDGMAKSFKSTEEGGEAIVQILVKKDCLMDIGTTGGPSSLGAKTIAKSRILALALPSLREQLARNPTLAQNMLALSSGRLQRFVAHFEQITLRQASERVGWFFVNLHLETGLEGAPLKLPFDKALIASYLNIKPETFSRVLNQFRKEGFIINKDEVILPHPQALCAYCDPDMASRCCRAEAVNCAPVRIMRRAGAQ